MTHVSSSSSQGDTGVVHPDVVQEEDSLGWKDELKFGDTEFMLPARAAGRITFMMSRYIRQPLAVNCLF